MSTKPSSEFLSLLKGLLEKDVSKRLSWKQLIRHAFWEGKLVHLIPMTTKSIIIDGKETLTDDDQMDMELLIDRHHLSIERPKTAAHDQKPEMNVSFSMRLVLYSSSAVVVNLNNNLFIFVVYVSSRLPVSPQSTIHTRNPLQCQESDETNNQQQQPQSNSTSYSNNNPNYKEYRKLFFLNSESNASQIIDNTKVRFFVNKKLE